MDGDLKWKTFVAMANMGGFVSKLADAWFAADASNKARIEGAFNDLIERYAYEFCPRKDGA